MTPHHKYDWQSEISAEQLNVISDLVFQLTGTHMVGLAVGADKNGEGAMLFCHSHPFQGVELADIAQDISADANHFYEYSKEVMLI